MDGSQKQQKCKEQKPDTKVHTEKFSLDGTLEMTNPVERDGGHVSG